MMNFFKKNKKTWDKPFSEKVARRVSKLNTAEMEGWVDQSLYDIGRTLSLYQKSRDPIYLDELLLGAEALHAIVNEINKRTPRR